METTDATISRTIRALVAYHGLQPQVMWEALGVARGTYYDRLANGGWSAEEVARAADILSVPVADLYQGLAA